MNYKQLTEKKKVEIDILLEQNLSMREVGRRLGIDNGLELKALGIAAKRLGVKLYKCDPYCSFQRGVQTKEQMP